MNHIRTVSVIGAGIMGPDIAAIFARHKYNVRLMDLEQEALQRAERAIDSVYQTLVAGGMMTEDEVALSKGYLTLTQDQDRALENADFVVEAIPEKLELKKAIFAEIESKVNSATIMASNSSGIPIAEIAEAVTLPHRVIGTHWLNQPHIIPVVEVVKDAQTAAETVETTQRLLRQLGMIPVLVHGNLPGFIHNRILFAIYREVLYLLEQGVVSAEDVDKVTKWAIGPKLSALGPLELLDVAGLDTYLNVASYLNPELNSSKEVNSFVRESVEKGNLGIKAGQGVYKYQASELPGLMQRRRRLMIDIVRLKYRAERGANGSNV